MRYFFLAAALTAVSWVGAAELRFDFGATPVGSMPTNFHSVAAGDGKSGNWRVQMDEVPPTLAPLTTQAPANTRRAVLVQTAQSMADEHFPMLVFDGESFADFTLTTRF
ncbi:MAG: hypothetical protein RLY20_1204, partial [Verrucomicrobiota bacterium]